MPCIHVSQKGSHGQPRRIGAATLGRFLSHRLCAWTAPGVSPEETPTGQCASSAPVHHSAWCPFQRRPGRLLTGGEAIPAGEVFGASFFVESSPAILGAPARIVDHRSTRVAALQPLGNGVQPSLVVTNTTKAVLPSERVNLSDLPTCHSARVGTKRRRAS
jgi:hypothetical protein